MENPRLSVSDFIAVTNQALENIYPLVEVEGEVASFKVNQGKFVFFDIKDAGGSVGCFMMKFSLRVPIEDGMKVIVVAQPKLTQWGKFSLTVRSVRPSGEGALKKSLELLRKKLAAEGLFSPERKRLLPSFPQHVAVISSTAAAGYADFVHIINNRWGGVRINVAHTQVQGEKAPDQIIRAIKHFNEQEKLPEVLVIIRGGGSKDDLAAFNDELLVREIAASRIPTLVGVGHETDESLADLAADVRAVTPSNAAQILVPDREEIKRDLRSKVRHLLPKMNYAIGENKRTLHDTLRAALDATLHQHALLADDLAIKRRMLEAYDPNRVLVRGYAIVRGRVEKGANIEVETRDTIITAEVKEYEQK